MDGQFIIERHHPQISAVEFGNRAPEAIAISLLRFRPEWVFNDRDTPLDLEIRAFAQDLVFKIGRELVLRHLFGIRRREWFHVSASLVT